MANVKVEIISGSVNGQPVGVITEVSEADFVWLEKRGYVKEVEEKKAAAKKAPAKKADEKKDEE